ncbi:TorD/DmsD family molecular chaperone [Seleniivibrio woodruffii]|uniref:TorD/DmsD family molecular chaperone n=1 Tax=Seleniivibrio woodruffii TaxID=1078050 RepID=UPI00240A4E1D|nr:molecular chaperone TorD family protein [Seleniivibrio woodruffii]
MSNNEVTDESLAFALNGRNAVFNVLSKVFADVPSAETDRLVQEAIKGIVSFVCHTCNSDMLKGIDLLIPDSTDYSWDLVVTADSSEDRARDYTWLFLSGRGAISLNESVYLSPERLLMQEPWAAVKAFYYSNNIRCVPGTGITEDHLAAELQFMSITSEKAALMCLSGETDSMINILRVQREFYKNHILRWFSEVCNRITARQDRLNSVYYPVFAYILKGYINEDYRFICELTSE